MIFKKSTTVTRDSLDLSQIVRELSEDFEPIDARESDRFEVRVTVSRVHEFQVDRTGDRPLAFEGVEIFDTGEFDLQRWHRLTLFRSGSRLVVAIMYHSGWKDELPWDGAIVAETDEDLTAKLRAYDPCARLRFPPAIGEAKQRRDEAARNALRDQWANAVSDVLECLEPERL